MKTIQGYRIPDGCRLFRNIPRPRADDILAALGAVMIYYAKGERSIAQWSKITHHFLVVSGEVHAYYYHADGRRTVTGVFRPGDDYGLTFAFSDMHENPSASFATVDTVVIKIPIIDITTNPLLTRDRYGIQYIQNVVETISQSAFNARLRSFVVSHPSVECRIMAYLIEKSKHFGSREFDISLDRQEFADFIDCDRSTLCSTLSKMNRRGIIGVNRNHFVLLKQ